MPRPSLPFRKSQRPQQRRRRAITPPFLPLASTTSKAEQPPLFLPQTRCAFLFELPYELRFQIYEELLGPESIAVGTVDEWASGKLQLRKKEKTKPGKKKTWNGKGGKVANGTSEEGQQEDGQTAGSLNGILSLMKTCRLFYTELHTILLGHPITIPSLVAFRWVSDIIPTTHYHHLKHLTLTFYLPYLLFPVRQIPEQNSWLRRTVKQLQHFDVPSWIWAWQMLGNGTELELSKAISASLEETGKAQAMRKSSKSKSSGGSGVIGHTTSGLTGLTSLNVVMIARDYTSFHPAWPAAPEDLVAELLYEPILACARSRGWPETWSAQKQQHRRAYRNDSSTRPGTREEALNNWETSQRTNSLMDWSITVSWPLAQSQCGRGGPPEKLFRNQEEMNAGLPFRLSSQIALSKVFNGMPAIQNRTGVAIGDGAGFVGSNSGSESGSESEQEEDDDDDHDDGRSEEDSGDGFGGAGYNGLDGERANEESEPQEERPRLWWEV